MRRCRFARHSLPPASRSAATIVGMAKVKVYRVKVYDAHSDQWVISPRMATREGVAIMHGKIVEDTGIEIDDSELEYGEKWTAKNFKP
jgi:hypothetical protein